MIEPTHAQDHSFGRDAFELLVQGVVDYALYMLDPQGRIVTWNPGAEKIKNYTAEEIIGAHFSRFYTEEDQAAGVPDKALQTAAETGRYSAEGWRVRKDGTRFWAMVVIDRILQNGMIVGFAKITRDLSEQRRTQIELEESRELLAHAQKMDAIGQLTGGLAHDFNNLLAGILGSLEMVKIRTRQGRFNEVERFVAVAEGAANRAAALTHRLLAFARRQTLDPKPVDTNKLVSGMEDLIRRAVGPGIHTTIVRGAGLWLTLCDDSQLESALLNLAINARDAMPDGGRLTIETTNAWIDDRAARTLDVQPGQYIAVSVSDTGMGMSPEIASKAFDPFFTTKPIGEGTGLGLSMIYGFVKQSGGHSRIYSEVAKGTTIKLYLPRFVGELVEEEPPSQNMEAPAVSHETVLVVEDEPSVRMLVTEVLGEIGCAALEAGQSKAALKILRSDARIDLLVTDVGLPEGLNGRQLADAARETRPGLKVLFITGYAENAALNDGHIPPGMHILTKPFALETLAARIRSILAEA